MKIPVLRGNILSIVIIIMVILIAVSALYFKFTQRLFTPISQIPNTPKTTQPQRNEIDELKAYTSQASKISLSYPKDWYIDDRYQKLLITNYLTNLNRDDHPSEKQIELLISLFSGCHKTIEENLIDPACGEGGPTIKKNKILSKEMRETKGGTLYKYVVESPNNKFTYYLLQNEDKILKISKQPDPSQFEKEFENLINSIRFLQ